MDLRKPLRGLTLAALTAGLAACAPSPKPSVHWDDEPPPPPSAPPSQTSVATSAQREDIVKTALSYLGAGYQLGGDGPDRFDCSGLVMTVYETQGIQLPRTCAQQSERGQVIPRDEILPGDLVFFGDDRGRPSHVGIYVGEGEFVHASTGRGKVRTDMLGDGYFRREFQYARSLLDR